MANKFLTRRGYALFAGILLLLALTGVSQAQDTGGDTNDAEVLEVDAVGDGTGQIVVELSGTAAINRVTELSISPSQVVTDLIDVGTSTSKTFTLTHAGADDAPAISIEQATLFGTSANEFSSSFNGFETLSPGQSIEVTVTFTPLTTGDKAAGLRLTISGATAPYVVLFTGSARYPLTSDLGQSDKTIVFGQTLQNSDSQKNFILTNEGTDEGPAIFVSAIQLSGTNAGEFTVNFTPTSLNPGEQLDVKVDLNTGVAGFKSAIAEVFHDGNNGALEVVLEGTVVEPQAVAINFTTSTLNTSQNITRGTTLQFGPDGKLYVGEMTGTIYVFDVTRNGKNNYTGTVSDTITLVKNTQNHDDDGTPNATKQRTMTGIHVTGTAAAPVIYASSSDWRQAAGPSGTDSNLDTNSGVLHKLTKNGGNWTKQDMVRGLPRSEENHGPNGLVKVGNKIYLSVGGHTNQGAPSNNFAELPEYALSSAVLEINLDTIGDSTYDLPTLDGPSDQNDPFGGNDGLNQAILEIDGPVKIFATGFRNAYDIVYTETGRFYTWDNGPNAGWGGEPSGNCSNNLVEVGASHKDGLHLISQGYYAGHPNPTRGNKDNKFGGQSPIEGDADPVECNYKTPGQNDGSLVVNSPSTNGIDEYTASNFAGSMQGDLIAAAFNKVIYRVEFNGNGTAITSNSALLEDLGTTPLDLTAQGDADVFPGTIWVADNIAKVIHILEPSDY
ncbi:choice-of-anchor D domain-containing protein [Granulosicoccus antarcticus]|uniref:HYDIN/VesB/CFA65-like Ig-like domain-containing protein n=1 Tax=Granulosicoccus antarcticus IMCC3135 TaxID=1192854 RepID=A0A2Z2P2B1_9GAMM|nr:choice-of-anchor D domain-containing protein [Granulosicoccus antarcticus]ASJ76428.1 hypothetical protein IMCC3135_31905 [Granulosicoccus antarcticus IMCC3135]